MTQTWEPPTQPTQPGSAPTTPQAPPAGLARNPVVPGAVMTMLGGLLIVFGSFLPWLTATAPLIGTINRSGMDGGGDGVITLVLGVLTILIGVTRLTATAMPALLWRSSIITGAITGAVAFNAYVQVQDRIAEVKDAAGELAGMITANMGAGIWALFIGAAFAVGGGLLVRKTT